MKNCVLYIRTANKNEYSIINQKELLKYYAKQHGLIIKKVFIDNGYSGINFQKPNFLKMVTYIKDNNIKNILIKDVSRLSRDIYKLILFLEKMKNIDINIITVM